MTWNRPLLALALGCFFLPQDKASARPDPPDILAVIKRDDAQAKKIGLAKLTASEQDALGGALKAAYILGWESSRDMSAKAAQGPARDGVTAVVSKVDELNDSIVKLRNGMIVELTSLAPTYVGFGKDCIVFKSGSGHKIWIAGKKTYRCDIIKSSDVARKRSIREDSIEEVRGNGALIKLLSSGLFEVDSLATITTSLWLPGSAVLVIDGTEMVCLDGGDDIVSVRALR